MTTPVPVEKPLPINVPAAEDTEAALGFVFDPREKDFPFAALTMAAVPFAATTLLNRPKKGIRCPCRKSNPAGK
jgi:hypothetical protein